MAFLRRFARVLLVIAGFVLLALFIWFFGPYFQFAEYAPLESAAARLYTIAAIVGLYVLWRAIKRLRAAMMSDGLAAAVLKQAMPAKAEPSAEAVKLRERFEEGLQTLKGQRKSGRSLYELPWYVIIGAPGSGKTTALLNSGLKFPLDPRGGRAVKGVGGTRNCDWFFAEEAVLLDTAGRYTTQDSDAASDSEGWAEFLALLRKYRKRRPINGVILAISAHDLMVQGDARREEHVEAARKRLIELNRELRIQLPVYLLVTKCDLVAGFTEYFDDLSREGRAQVWGVTFPYEHTMSGDAAQAFPARFEELVERLNERVSARVEEERDIRRRARIFAFPQQFAAIGDPLAAFVSDVFATSRFERQVLLRGVYLTSGTQEGTPIDRLLGTMVRDLSLGADAVAAGGGRGKAYFVERLLKEVMIGESGLAGVDTRGEVAKAAVHLGAYAAVALVTIVGVLALTWSHRANQRYLAEVRAQLTAFAAVPPGGPRQPAERLVSRLDALARVSDTANAYPEGAPWGMRWGLYQGTSVGNAALDAYAREVDALVLPQVRDRLRQRVVQRQNDPEQLYEALKPYLMLGDTAHLDVALLTERIELEWPPSGNAATLGTHFRKRLAASTQLPPLLLDGALVAQSRKALRQASIEHIVYQGIRQQYGEDSVRVVTFDQGGAGAGVIKRKSGIGLSPLLPAIYSKGVFNEVTDGKTFASLVQRFAQDDWVLGDQGGSVLDAPRLAESVAVTYERDYIAAWDRVLSDLEIAQPETSAQVGPVLEVLGGPASPLRRIVDLVAEHTNFAPAPAAAPTGAIASMTQTLGKGLKSGRDILGLRSGPAGASITAHFQPYHRLRQGEAGQRPIDRLIDAIAKLHLEWIRMAPKDGEIAAISNDPQLMTALSQLRQETQTLPPELRALVARIATGTDHVIDVTNRTIEVEKTTILEVAQQQSGDVIATMYREQVLPECRRIVNGRYPFSTGSDQNVPLLDFSRLFGPEGVLDSFFQAHLSALADTTGKPWRWKEGRDTQLVAARLPGDILRVFQNAADVRDAFFQPGAKAIGMQFAARLLNFDEAAATRFQLDIEGQVIDSQQRPWRSATVVWPGKRHGLVTVDFAGRWGTPARDELHGPWAWFRLLERSNMRRDSETRNVAVISVRNMRAEVEIEATTIHNPFATADWQSFRCGS